jgi:hypothetical protein
VHRPPARAALWLLTSSVFLLVGFAAAVAGMYFLGLATGSIDPENPRAAQIAMATYFRVVFFKGLLPQLALALALWPVVRRLLPWAERSRLGMAAGLALAGGVAYAVVAPLLLSSASPGWPALQMRGLDHHVGTATLTTGAVAFAGLVARLLEPGLRPSGDSKPGP